MSGPLLIVVSEILLFDETFVVIIIEVVVVEKLLFSFAGVGEVFDEFVILLLFSS